MTDRFLVLPARVLSLLLLLCGGLAMAELTVENTGDDVIVEDAVAVPIAPIVVSGASGNYLHVSLYTPGFFVGEWQCAELPAGVYFYNMATIGQGQTTEIDGPPAGVNAALASLRFSVAPDINYPIPVFITADDGKSPAAGAYKWITIQPVNDPPVLPELGRWVVKEDELWGLPLGFVGVSDADGDPLTLTWTISAAAVGRLDYSSYNPATLVYSGPVTGVDGKLSFSLTGSVKDIQDAKLTLWLARDFNGEVPYSIRVSDGTVTVDAAGTLLIQAVNDAALITGQLPVVTSSGQARTILKTDLVVSDPDKQYPVGFNLYVDAGSGYTRSGPRGTIITPDAGFVGTLSIPLKANDGFLDSNTFMLQMVVNPTPAVVMTSGRIAGAADGAQVLSYLGNPGQVYTIQYSDSLEDWQTLVEVAADAQGQIRAEDHPPAGVMQRYYRMLVP